MTFSTQRAFKDFSNCETMNVIFSKEFIIYLFISTLFRRLQIYRSGPRTNLIKPDKNKRL